MFDGTRVEEKMRDGKMENRKWKTEDDEEGLSMPGLGCWIPYFEVPADSPSVRVPYDMIIVIP